MDERTRDLLIALAVEEYHAGRERPEELAGLRRAREVVAAQR